MTRLLMNKLHIINPVYLQLSSQVTVCHDLFDVVRRKGPPDLPVESTHSTRLFRRLTHLQGPREGFPQVFQSHDLARRAARTSLAYRDFGPGILFGTTGGKDLQTLQMRVLIRSLHLVRRVTQHQALGIFSPWCFSRMTLLAVPQELP